MWQNGFLNFYFAKGYSVLIKTDTLYFRNVGFFKALLLKFIETVICFQRSKILLNKNDINRAFTKMIENACMLKNQWSHMKLKVVQIRLYNEIIVLNKV